MKKFLTATISASAIQHNMRLLRELVGPKVKICPVIKDDCYGHNMRLIYPLLRGYADGLCVASPHEALVLRDDGYTGFVLCFLSAYCDDYVIQDKLVFQEVTQTIMSSSALASVQASARRVGKVAKVHLKVDTGMGRLGVPARQAARLMREIQAADHVQLTGVYTHYATADEADRTAAEEQLRIFKEMVPDSDELMLHTANSAATLDMPETHFNMVRPGIAVYGCHPSDALRNRLPLKPCMRVTAKLIAVKHMPKGSRSGYGLTYTYDRDSVVGVAPIGYGDGYFRSLSNRAVVRVCGKDAAVRGRISMDQITVDLTDIPEAGVGDEVEVISRDPLAPNSVENLARLADTIPYEITCRLGHTIQHVLVD
jgi:alanine racemase